MGPVRMYGMTIQMNDVYMCIPPEDGPEIGSKRAVGKNKLLMLDSCVDGIVRIMWYFLIGFSPEALLHLVTVVI
jgi:hypothetical protein